MGQNSSVNVKESPTLSMPGQFPNEASESSQQHLSSSEEQIRHQLADRNSSSHLPRSQNHTALAPLPASPGLRELPGSLSFLEDVEITRGPSVNINDSTLRAATKRQCEYIDDADTCVVKRRKFSGSQSPPQESMPASLPAITQFMPAPGWTKTKQLDARDPAVRSRSVMSDSARTVLESRGMLVLEMASQLSWGDKQMLSKPPNDLFALAKEHCNLDPEAFSAAIFADDWTTLTSARAPVWKDLARRSPGYQIGVMKRDVLPKKKLHDPVKSERAKGAPAILNCWIEGSRVIKKFTDAKGKYVNDDDVELPTNGSPLSEALAVIQKRYDDRQESHAQEYNTRMLVCLARRRLLWNYQTQCVSAANMEASGQVRHPAGQDPDTGTHPDGQEVTFVAKHIVISMKNAMRNEAHVQTMFGDTRQSI